MKKSNNSSTLPYFVGVVFALMLILVYISPLKFLAPSGSKTATHSNPNTYTSKVKVNPQNNNSREPTTRDPLSLVASGHLNLIKLSGSAGTGTFCALKFDKHMQDPSTYPMFRDLVKVSKCDSSSNTYNIPLDDAVRAARDYDKEHSISSSLPRGFVFHESRCGSTLAANSLAVAADDHRVYSESAPVPTAVRTGKVNTIRDVIYLMSRGPGGEAAKTFFKFQSIMSLSMDLILKGERLGRQEALSSECVDIFLRGPLSVSLSTPLHSNSSLCPSQRSLKSRGYLSTASLFRL